MSKFKNGDKVTLLKDMLHHKLGTNVEIAEVIYTDKRYFNKRNTYPVRYNVLIVDSVLGHFVEDELEFTEIYNSPLYKAMS